MPWPSGVLRWGERFMNHSFPESVRQGPLQGLVVSRKIGPGRIVWLMALASLLEARRRVIQIRDGRNSQLL